MHKGSVGWDLESLERLTGETSDRATDSDDESEEEVQPDDEDQEVFERSEAGSKELYAIVLEVWGYAA